MDHGDGVRGAGLRFLSQLFRIALPITLQYLFSSSLNLVGGLMVGQLGETAVAAVGLANQVNFLLIILLFGISSGSAIFTAQLWGVRDVANIRRVLGLSLLLGEAAAALFVVAALFFPGTVLGFYTQDPAVIALGSDYLRLLAPSFVPMAAVFAYSAALRSTGDVRTPLVVGMAAMTLNALLSYSLIFGLGGLPALGVRGVSVAVCTAKILECAALIWLVYRNRSPVAATLRQMAGIDRPFVAQVLSRALPVIVGEMLWSLGMTTYNAVYAHIGTEAIAAVNIVVTIEGVAFVVFMGIAEACAILVGNRIGAGQVRSAYRYAGASLALAVAGAWLMGLIVWLAAGNILVLYKVSPTVVDYARHLIVVLATTMWIRVSNMVLIVGIMRSGGDTRFAFLLDAGSVWLVGVPLAFLGAFAWHWPVYQVYLLVMAEEAVKWLVGLGRYLSRRWINNLAHAF